MCGKYIPLSARPKPRLLQTSIGSAVHVGNVNGRERRRRAPRRSWAPPLAPASFLLAFPSRSLNLFILPFRTSPFLDEIMTLSLEKPTLLFKIFFFLLQKLCYFDFRSRPMKSFREFTKLNSANLVEFAFQFIVFFDGVLFLETRKQLSETAKSVAIMNRTEV